MFISEAAKLLNVTPVTLRYYERIGLIPPVARINGGIRQYTKADIQRIELITWMRNAGVSIETLEKYVTLLNTKGDTILPRKRLLIQERTKLYQEYLELARKMAQLDQKIAAFDGRTNHCNKHVS